MVFMSMVAAFRFTWTVDSPEKPLLKEQKEKRMDELLKKANIPNDHSMYIGKLIDEPFLEKTTFSNDFSISDYSLHTRPLWSCGYKVTGEKAR